MQTKNVLLNRIAVNAALNKTVFDNPQVFHFLIVLFAGGTARPVRFAKKRSPLTRVCEKLRTKSTTSPASLV